MKEPWKIFYLNGKEISAYTIRGTFKDEEQATKELLSFEHNVPIEKIAVKIKNR